MRIVTIGILSMIILMVSCKKDDTSSVAPTNPINEDYYLNVKVDGVYYSAPTEIVFLVFPDENYSIITEDDDIGISLSIDDTLTVGTFVTESGKLTRLSYTEKATNTTWTANQNVGGGSIIVTENNPNFVKGTFSFTGVNALDGTIKEFTEGEFRVQRF